MCRTKCTCHLDPAGGALLVFLRSHLNLLQVLEEAEQQHLYGKLAAGSELADEELRQQLQKALRQLALAQEQSLLSRKSPTWYDGPGKLLFY